MNVEKIRDAAKTLDTLVRQGMDHDTAEEKVFKEKDLDEFELERMRECYWTEYATDDG